MKRIIAAISAALMIMCFSVNSYASQSEVKITGNDNTVSFSYSSDNPSTNSKSIKTLLKDIDEVLNGETVTQKITISSNSENPVIFRLRLEKPVIIKAEQAPVMVTPTPNPEDNSVLDFFNIYIKDNTGDIIYDYNTSEKTDATSDFKDIELFPMNYENTLETVEYEITISKNPELESMASEAAMLDWLIVTDGYSQSIISDDIPDTTHSDKLEGNIIERSLDKGTYTVGQDLLKGRYEISGESTVSVYTEDGDLKTKIILTRENNSETGVKSYVLNLFDNEVVEVSAETDFVPYTPSKTTATAKPQVKPTATTPAKALTTAKSNVKSTAKATTAPKANPKTGDLIPVTLMLITGTLSVATVGFMEYKKRKNN